MITGKTESGFEFELADNIKDDYEVVEALVRYFKKLTYENFVTFKDLMFRGSEDCEKRAKDFLRERDGYVKTSAVIELVFEIWNAAKELKN
jgi:hypothetical protein